MPSPHRSTAASLRFAEALNRASIDCRHHDGVLETCGVSVTFTEADSVGAVPRGSVAAFDWSLEFLPRRLSQSPLAGGLVGLRGVVTYPGPLLGSPGEVAVLGLRSLAVPLPVIEREPLITSADAGSSFGFQGWLWDSRTSSNRDDVSIVALGQFGAHLVDLPGTVYTLEVDPDDEDWQWVDVLQAFVAGLRRQPEATLLLRVPRQDPLSFADMLQGAVRFATPYDCRIVVAAGPVDGEQYDRMLASTAYAVASLPLDRMTEPVLDLMGAGVPGIGPDSGSLAGIITAASGFPVSTYRRPTWRLRTPDRKLHYWGETYVWPSLANSLVRALRLHQEDAASYERMQREAAAAVRAAASAETVTARLVSFLRQL